VGLALHDAKRANTVNKDARMRNLDSRWSFLNAEPYHEALLLRTNKPDPWTASELMPITIL